MPALGTSVQVAGRYGLAAFGSVVVLAGATVLAVTGVVGLVTRGPQETAVPPTVVTGAADPTPIAADPSMTGPSMAGGATRPSDVSSRAPGSAAVLAAPGGLVLAPRPVPIVRPPAEQGLCRADFERMETGGGTIRAVVRVSSAEGAPSWSVAVVLPPDVRLTDVRDATASGTTDTVVLSGPTLAAGTSTAFSFDATTTDGAALPMIASCS